MGIKKNIIQTCANKQKLDQDQIQNIENIKYINPDWDYQLFDDSEVNDFFSDFFGAREKQLLARINKKYGVVYADIFRYANIYKNGGVYIDLKSTITADLDRVLPKESKFIISQWRNRLGEQFSGWGLHNELIKIPGGEFQQWHVVAEEGHPFLSHVLEKIFKNIEIYDSEIFGVGKIAVLRLTGPICYTSTIFPLMSQYPYTICDVTRLGFQYSIYQNIDAMKHAKVNSHYSKLTEKVVNNDQVSTSQNRRKLIFSTIYEKGIWGKSKDPSKPFYSGSGSHEASVVSNYTESVNGFLKTFPEKPNVVDFGCGDFSVGSKIRPLCNEYVACDIVPELIDFNKEKYQQLDVDFKLLDLVSDDYLCAEIVFIRQVLQHLSNSEIETVIPKLKKNFKYLVLTEHLPSNAHFPHNIDKQTGSTIRLDFGSGIVLTSSPFNLDVIEERILCEVHQYGGIIRTTLYKLQN